MRRAAPGATAVEFGLVLAVLFVGGLTAWQFAGVGMAAIKVSQAAHEAAYTAGSTLAINATATPCWEASGGLRDPARFGDPEVCRAVTASIAGLDPDLTSVSVERHISPGRVTSFQVTVTYRQPISSPVLRLFLGPTFVITSQASSWSG